MAKIVFNAATRKRRGEYHLRKLIREKKEDGLRSVQARAKKSDGDVMCSVI